MKSVRLAILILVLNQFIHRLASGEGAILPTWTSVDTNNVKTSRELWEHMKKEGWNVDVCAFI